MLAGVKMLTELWGLQTLSRKLPFWEDGAPKSPHAIMAGILNGEVRHAPLS